MQKISVAVLGATGLVGQNIVRLLQNHPLFEIKYLCASDSSVGLHYLEALKTPFEGKLCEKIAQKKISSCLFEDNIPIIFSALDSYIAEEIESFHLQKGSHIISNAKNFRMKEDIPLLIPEVNPDHIQLIELQKTKGKIITNPNCVVAGLTLALKPLEALFGIERMHLATYQALSGAGYNGPSALQMQDNLLPHIEGEEEKIETEPLKILGLFNNNKINLKTFKISAQVCRVPITHGHFMNVSVQLKNKVSLKEVEEAFNHFHFASQTLPSFEKPLVYFENKHLPQPKSHIHLGHGLTVSVGKLQECKCLDIKFNVLVHNLIRGAAGAALLNAELFVQKYPSLVVEEKQLAFCQTH